MCVAKKVNVMYTFQALLNTWVKHLFRGENSVDGSKRTSRLAIARSVLGKFFHPAAILATPPCSYVNLARPRLDLNEWRWSDNFTFNETTNVESTDKSDKRLFKSLVKFWPKIRFKMLFFPTGCTCTTQAHSFTTTTCFYGAIESAVMWAVSSPDHFRKIAFLGIGGVSIWLQLLWILRQCNASIWDEGATVIKQTIGCLGEGVEYVSYNHHLCRYRHLHSKCCRWFVSSPLMFLAAPMKQTK